MYVSEFTIETGTWKPRDKSVLMKDVTLYNLDLLACKSIPCAEFRRRWIWIGATDLNSESHWRWVSGEDSAWENIVIFIACN